MKFFNRFFILGLVMSLGLNYTCAAQKIFILAKDATNEPVQGGSTNPAFLNQIEAVSFGQQSTGCPLFTPSSCLVTTGEFILNMAINKSIIQFKKGLYSRENWKSVVISFATATNEVYYQIKLKDVFITGVSEAVNGALGEVQIKFDPTKITWENPDTGAGFEHERSIIL